jgi:cytoskeletal protein CcmA (bactofilin family)
MHIHSSFIKRLSLLATGMTALLLLIQSGGHALAASSWNPTLLVNTESFETLDEGDGTTNIEMRFGQTLQQKLYFDRSAGVFHFTSGLFVGGNLTATGSLSVKKGISGATLRIDGNSDLWGNLAVSGSTILKGSATVNGAATIGGNAKIRGNLSGSTLRVDKNADIWGTLSASGSIKTASGFVLNKNNAAADALLQFGNATATQSLKYSHANQRFEFSKDLKVNGSLSGKTLTVDGNVNLHGVTYNFSGVQGGANTYLKNDGAGNLTWTGLALGNGSGNIMSLHPEYPNAVYFASGSTTVGTLNYSYDSASKQNYYEWTSTKATLQDYWVSVRLQIPKNFSHFETASGMVLRLRTTSTSAANNFVSVGLLDTTGNPVSLTSNTTLRSGLANTWSTKTIGGVSTGTYTPGGYITILLRTAALTANVTDLGSIDLNWANTTP